MNDNGPDTYIVATVHNTEPGNPRPFGPHISFRPMRDEDRKVIAFASRREAQGWADTHEPYGGGKELRVLRYGSLAAYLALNHPRY